MKDERYKELMAQVGLPNSRSLLQALQQCAMEAALEERSKHNLKALPKKWEPRGGDWTVTVNIGVLHTQSSEGYRLAGREYPTGEEAERAAPLHRKMDRLVNWLVEHCPELSERDALIRSNVFGDVTMRFMGTPGNNLTANLNSGEVELDPLEEEE